jgi:outer membrane receptor protein involved in Fe transport
VPSSNGLCHNGPIEGANRLLGRRVRHLKSTRLASVLVLIVLALLPACLHAQTFVTITVEDSLGAALQGASVTDPSGMLLGHSDQSGILRVACAIPCTVHVTAPGFVPQSIELRAAMVIRMEAAARAEEVTVTAYRTPLGLLDSPVTTRLLSQSQLESAAAVTLDGELRQLPGLELFRRSSSLVANPSSQGISLRALGSTSASRTLVTQDDVPLNDAFAGTIHWLEQPELAIKSIEVMRGGGSDLYGSSAIGGVVSLLPVRPVSDQAALKSSYGAEGTFDDSLMLQSKRGRWGLLAAGGVLGTDGYIQEAPAQRGPVDIASNVHGQNGMVLVERSINSSRIFVRGSGFNEARHNGTPYQTNGTRIWRYATGDDWQGPHGGALVMRLYGSTEHFRQTFSSISNLPTSAYPACSYRCGEVPTKFSLTPNNELGAAAHWSQPLGAGLLLLAGADVRDVRVWDREQSFGSAASTTNLHDHQRDSAAYAETMWVRKAWTVTAAARMDWFQNYDGQQLVLNGTQWTPASSQPSQFDERFFDPRIGLSRKFLTHWSLSASGFRAFREPTPNELYRATQVGNQLTTPNGSLLSEHATGWETGLASQHAWGSVRASYFLTQVNRPIAAVTINSLSSPILLKRENLGQIESRGVSLDSSITPRRWLTVDGGYQYAHATFTQRGQDLGNWIPEVARNLATTNLRAHRRALGDLNLQARWSGRQFDDDANAYLLHGYFRLDTFVSHDFGKRFQFLAAGENLLNRKIEVSKTPTTTLAMPRAVRIGLMVRLDKGNDIR